MRLEKKPAVVLNHDTTTCYVDRKELARIVARMKADSADDIGADGELRIDVYEGGARLSVQSDGFRHSALVRLASESVTTGTIALPLERFARWLRTESAHTNIRLFKRPGFVGALGGGTEFKVATEETLPERFSGPATVSATMLVEHLSNAVDGVGYAVSPDQTRAHLAAMHLVVDGSCLCAEATDGHRMARVSVPITSGTSGEFFLGGRALESVSKALRKASSKAVVKIQYRANAGLWIEFDNEEFTAMRQPDIKFPRMDYVIPGSCQRSMQVKASDLHAYTDRVSSEGTVIEFAKDKSVWINGADATERHCVGAWSGEFGSLRIGVNTRYMAEALEAFGDQTIEIETTDEFSPFVLRPAHVCGSNETISLVMPLRI